MDITRINKLSQSIWTDYKEQANVTRRWLQDYNKEVQTYKDYRGREILELLQNADDAQSETVEINIDTKQRTLSILNSGSQTLPFTEDGIQSIMLSNLSPKKGKRLIGSKGLGFRSVLNWSDKIEIRSDNVSLRFGTDIVKNKWEELKNRVPEAEKFEKEAIRDGREVPLAILALPEIRLLNNYTQKSTSIILVYDQAYEENILNDLEKFQPESLLFLHHIEHITIVIDGGKKEYVKSCVKQMQDSIVEVKLNGNHWIQSYEHGKLDDTDTGYEVSCAFCLNQPHESYKIFSYFPTQTDFPFPCILHASLELDSSRNSLVSNDQNNQIMMQKLAEQIAIVATYLKEFGRHDWYPYMLMKPDASKRQNEYVSLLIKSVYDLSANGEFIPKIDGAFTNEDGYYYYSDRFSELTNKKDIGRKIFAGQRLINAPVYAVLNRRDLDMKQHIEEYAKHLSGDISTLAEYIKTLLIYCEDNSVSDMNFKILPESTGDMIQGTAYINTGMEIEDIPDFRQIKYVDGRLVSELKKILGLSGKEPDRDLVSRLKKITDVSATDVSAVTRNLLPKAADKNLEISQRQALIKCIFKLFLKRGKLFDMEDSTKPMAYLFSRSGEWLPANEMVLVDKRFPKGFDKLGISYTYQGKDSVQYPEYLLDIEGTNPEIIQQFYLSLGVQLYFKKELLHYGDDENYINSLPLPPQISSNCNTWRFGERWKNINTSFVGESDFFKELSLPDILKVIQVSDYYDCVCGGQQISWFKNKIQNPENVKLSYAAYKLRQIDKVSQLKYYVIDDDYWLAGFEPYPMLHFNKSNYREKALLEALGAKKSMKDFRIDELYNAVNNMECSFDGSTVGIAENYHSIIVALDAKGASVESLKNKTLRMLCRVKGQLEFRDSTEIYYSDNNELPNDLIKELPMLVMGRREGEQKIKRIVGCKTLKDIQVIIRQKCLDENLTKDLNRRIETRKPYILAFASKGVRTRGGCTSVLYNENVKSLLSSFVISVAENIDYQYAVEDKTLFTDKVMSMKDGELLCTDKEFFICSRSETLEDAMQAPRFIESVIEAICIKLNLSGSDIVNCFYRIFISNEKELNYYQKQEIDLGLWNECKVQFGMTEENYAFWAKVFKVNRCDFNGDMLREKKLAYLITALKIDPRRLASPDCFCEYHFQNLKEYRQKYKTGYLHSVYQQIAGDKTLHKEYIQRQTPFVGDEWLHDILEKNDNKYHIAIDYDDLLHNEMKSVFDYIPNDKDVIEHTKRKDYLDGIDEFHLSDEEKSLLFFDGYEDYFNGLREKQSKENDIMPQSDEEDSIELQVKEYTMSNSTVPMISSQKKRSGQKRKGNKKISDQRRIRLGYEAEDKVYEALTRSDIYKVIEVYSSHLSKTGGGDDSKGYDLEYKKEGDDMSRFLEIKHYDGKSIILTENEYNVSQKECRGRYDLALVTDNEVRIIRDALGDGTKFKKEINDYTIYFTIEDT